MFPTGLLLLSSDSFFSSVLILDVPSSLAEWRDPGSEPNFSALGCVHPAERLLL